MKYLNIYKKNKLNIKMDFKLTFSEILIQKVSFKL